MKPIIILLLITSCSAHTDNKECELECIECKKVTFTCSVESKEFELIKEVVL